MEQGLDAGRRAVAHGTKVAGWGGAQCPAVAAAPASAGAAGLGLGGRRSPPPEGSYSLEGRYSPPPRGSPRGNLSCGEGRQGADERCVLRVPVLELPPTVQTAPARPQPRRAGQNAALDTGCAAAAAEEGEDGEEGEEGAPTLELPPHLAEEVEVTVTGSGGAPGSGLTRGRLPGAMTPCVDSGGTLRWVRPTLSASGGALAAAVDSASQAKGLVYVSFKQVRCTACHGVPTACMPATCLPAACLQRACSAPIACP